MAIDVRTEPYVLEGRVVTMDGGRRVLDDGAVYIRQGRIEAVQPAAGPPPAGFEHATRVGTGDTLYPGLIELHNHLAYNAVPLWRVPRHYQHNASWRGTEEAMRAVSKPAEVLARTPGVAEAMVRYAEVRCLLGGVTTTQGITLATRPGFETFFKGFVRNVEQSLVDGLASAATRIENPPTGGAAGYLEDLEKLSCRLQHMSEGFGETARGWFLRLRFPDDDTRWAINGAFCAIHATALTRQDYRTIHARGGSVVWSPLSNYLLYGATADLDALKDSKVLVGLGSDWAPSGSKNLLGELKVARLASEDAGNLFSAEDLVAMVTVNPARICKWDGMLGSIEAGKLADIVAVHGTTGDPYEHLVEARESSVTLVTLDGIPRVGQISLMRRFEPVGTFEHITVGSADRLLDVTPASGVDPLGGLAFGEARTRLRQALADLPALAADIDSALVAPGFATDIDGVGGGDDLRWRVKLDFEEQDTELAVDKGLDLASLSNNLADWVEPMAFEEATVVDDPGFLSAIVHARNVPRFVKEGLPRAYGRTIAVPDEAALPDFDDDVRAELGEVGDLAAFLEGARGQLTLGDRIRIVDQALAVLEQHYVHLPFKRARYAVDPLQRLRVLRRELDEAGDQVPELDFHADLVETFTQLRDLHTTYQLPFPFRSRVAWLPFLVEECLDGDTTRYLVTRLIGRETAEPEREPEDRPPKPFRAGAEVVHWNGTPIASVVRELERSQAGSNPAARHFRAVGMLTIRPMGHMVPPREEWVTVGYRAPGSEELRELRHRWLVSMPRRGVGRVELDSLGAGATELGVDSELDRLNDIRKVFFAGATANTERRDRATGRRRPIQGKVGDIASTLPTVLRARRHKAGGRLYGYLRIFGFNVADPDEFVGECERLLKALPKNGLIIDVRGNGGGSIVAAEMLLELLSPEAIEPERAQLIATAANVRLCEIRSERFPGPLLAPWRASVDEALGNGAPYSLGFPITDAAALRTRSQVYAGPKVLVVDPLCYSATDIFAAGFVDHGIGEVLGVAASTGAGGANVWSHRVLRALFAEPGGAQPSPYEPLPFGSDLRIAIRRTLRVREHAGEIVEDFGVRTENVAPLTAADVLGSNEDLLAAAVDLLKQQKRRAIEAEPDAAGRRRGKPPVLVVRTKGVERLDVTVNGWRLGSRRVVGGEARIDLADYEGPPGDALEVELAGLTGDRVVVRRRLHL